MSSGMKKLLLVLLSLLMLTQAVALGDEFAVDGDGDIGGVSVYRTETPESVSAPEKSERPAKEVPPAPAVQEVSAPVQAEKISVQETPSAPVTAGTLAEIPAEPELLTQATDAQYAQTYAFVERMYRVVLGRNPDAVGAASWTAGLLDGSLTAADIVNGFFNSAEYVNSKRSNSRIVTDCYRAMLNRSPDKNGLEAWVATLDIGMTPQNILAGFVGSQEFNHLAQSYGITPGTIATTNARDENFERTYFVYRLYANCLGRTPDTIGLESWCRALSQGATGAEVASGFIFSKELMDQHLNNYWFVNMMYNTILGREGDEIGLDAWADVLNYSSTREHVFNGFLFSPEFAQQCERSGINVGSTIYEPDATPEWQNNITILTLCNQYRAARGIAPLNTREDLWADVAMPRARELSTLFSASYRPDYRSVETAYNDAGLDYWWKWGNNIGGGYDSANAVFNAWINSSGQRNRILDPDFDEMATGYYYDPNTRYGHHWSSNFVYLYW